MKNLSAVIFVIGLVALAGFAHADCSVTDINENSSLNGRTLTAYDCTTWSIGLYEYDDSYVDLYRVTLTSSGLLTVTMDSSAIDSYLGLAFTGNIGNVTSARIVEDDDSGSGLNARISLNLDAGSYIIGASSYEPETGPYSLTVSFTPESQGLYENNEVVPVPPVIDISTSGINVTASWNSIGNATGYTMFYAPYPDVSYIESVEMGNQTSFSVDLWQGAAFYVAVQAYNTAGYSGYSNIAYFVIESGSDSLDSLSGSYTYETYNPTLSGDCDLIYSLMEGSSIIGTHGQMEVEQSGREITIMVKGDDTPDVSGLEGTFSGIHDGWIELNGTINGNTFDAAYAESASLDGFNFAVGLRFDGTMEGDSFSGDGNATISLDGFGFNENCNVRVDYEAHGR